MTVTGGLNSHKLSLLSFNPPLPAGIPASVAPDRQQRAGLRGQGAQRQDLGRRKGAGEGAHPLPRLGAASLGAFSFNCGPLARHPPWQSLGTAWGNLTCLGCFSIDYLSC